MALFGVASTLALGVPSVQAAIPAVPIQQQAPGASALLPQFEGAPANPQPFNAPEPPANPFQAANGRSGIHDDAYQSDTYRNSGPVGRDIQVLSTELNAECASVTFDRKGRLLTICVGVQGPTLFMLDPDTLATLATYTLPPRQPNSGALTFLSDFSGGGYFYLDNHDRAVVPTTDRHIQVIAETDGPSPGFHLVKSYDLTPHVSSGDKITSALPDFSGRIWFESSSGVVGAIDPATGSVHAKALGEEAENSFAVDETNGVYIVTNKALYRFQARSDGVPRTTWRATYPNSGVRKPGQVNAGSGATPTIQNGFVTITDNGDPLDIVVFRRKDGRRVCTQPIFQAGSGADENSLIGAGNTMIAENNYGYSGPASTEGGGTTTPGSVRVDIDADGSGCHVVWRNDTQRIPSVVSKLSLASGLIYTYTKDTSSPLDPWYFTTLDVRTGRAVYKRLAGTGLGYNNNYAPVTIGPDGSAYVGTLGGLVELRDATPPPSATSGTPGCLNSRGGVNGTRLGPAVLGRTLRTQRRYFKGTRLKSRPRMDRYCAAGGGSFRIGYTTKRLARSTNARERKRVSGRAVLILTSSKRFSVAGIVPGSSVRNLRAKLKGERKLRIGKNTWYVANGRRSRLIFRVRGNTVQAVGIADRWLTTSTAGGKRLLTAWRLG